MENHSNQQYYSSFSHSRLMGFCEDGRILTGRVTFPAWVPADPFCKLNDQSCRMYRPHHGSNNL